MSASVGDPTCLGLLTRFGGCLSLQTRYGVSPMWLPGLCTLQHCNIAMDNLLHHMAKLHLGLPHQCPRNGKPDLLGNCGPALALKHLAEVQRTCEHFLQAGKLHVEVICSFLRNVHPNVFWSSGQLLLFNTCKNALIRQVSFADEDFIVVLVWYLVGCAAVWMLSAT